MCSGWRPIYLWKIKTAMAPTIVASFRERQRQLIELECYCFTPDGPD